MAYNIQYLFNIRTKSYHHKGTAIVETAVGLVVLVPVLLLLLDVVALVIGQTVNDDLAKSAARAASVAQSSIAGQLPSQTDGLAAANVYLDSTLYKGSTGLISQAWIPDSQFIWDTTNNMVTVHTQVLVTLPIPVPMGPSSQVMNAQASEPILSIPATPPVTNNGS